MNRLLILPVLLLTLLVGTPASSADFQKGLTDAYVLCKIICVRLTVRLRKTVKKERGLALSVQYHMFF